jgi:prephenate dehydrogenase
MPVPGDPPYFRRVAVIGIGLIGASFALAAKRAGRVGYVVGVARREETRRAARAIGAADETTPDPVPAVRGAELVYLATPVGALPGLLRTIAAALAPGCLVTDAGSVKAPVCQAAEALPASVRFVGGHPLAGSERSGPQAARADLFQKHVYFLVPTPRGGDEAAQQMARLVEALGARPVTISALEHDRLLAATSHLPHAVAVALMLAISQLVPDARQRAEFSATGLRDTTRIAASSPEVWRDIFLANARPLREACQLTIRLLQELVEAAEAGDGQRLKELLAQSQQVRQALETSPAARG